MDVFVDIDQSTWTQDQKNMTAAIAYALAHDAGQTLVPKVTDGRVSFTDPTFDVHTVITAKAILDRYGLDNLLRDEASISRQARFKSIHTELDDLKIQMVSDDANWNALTDLERIVAMKKVLRAQVLKNQLENLNQGL